MTPRQELIVEILLRLPARSLLRSKSVCKSWRSLISNPQFAKSHIDLSAAPTHRLLLLPNLSYHQVESIDLDSSIHDRSALVTLDLPPSTISRVYNPQQFLGSCRGFLLFFYQTAHHVILWNPTTRFHLPVPGLCSQDFSSYKSVFGLGYDKSTDDY